MHGLNARNRLALIALTPLAMSLAACGPKPIAVAVKPPVELLTCEAEPATPILPAPGIERDRIVAAWVLALLAAGGDCRAKVAGVRAWADAL